MCRQRSNCDRKFRRRHHRCHSGHYSPGRYGISDCYHRLCSVSIVVSQVLNSTFIIIIVIDIIVIVAIVIKNVMVRVILSHKVLPGHVMQSTDGLFVHKKTVGKRRKLNSVHSYSYIV